MAVIFNSILIMKYFTLGFNEGFIKCKLTTFTFKYRLVFIGHTV